MAITGLSLILFLIVHVTVNALMWAVIFVPEDRGEIYNSAAHFLGQTLVPRVLEIGLFLFFIIHIIQGYVLEFQNRSRRGVGYKVAMGSKGSRWYRKSMGLLGTIIFLFLIIHLSDFWIGSRFGDITSPNKLDSHGHYNLYAEMMHVFLNPWVVVLYILGCISLCWHLIHGFQASFRSLGLHNHKYIKLINGTGIAFSVIVTLMFAMMPVSVYFKWVS